MKNAVCFVLIAVMLLLGSCNMGIGLGSYTFTKVHICLPGGVNKCIPIEKWYDDDMGIEVYSEEYGALYLSEGTYILVESKCPICGE